MNRLATGEMPDLEPARKPWCYHHSVRPGLADRGQETLFTYQSRDLVMLGLVAERAGHAAAAGVEVDHLRAGDRRSSLSIGPVPTNDRW